MYGLGDAYYKNSYYIHYHTQNIGKLINGNLDDLITIYNAQKQKASITSQDIYKSAFIGKINEDGINLLSSAMDLDEDEVFTTISNSIGDELQKTVDIDNLSSFMDIKRNINSNISNLLKPKEEGLEAFNNILTSISQALELLNDPNASALAAALLDAINGRSGAFYMGNRLQQALNNFKANNNGKIVELKSLQTIITRLNNLAIAMKTKTTVKGKTLTKDSIKRSIGNIINNDIAKGLSIMIDTSANVSADNEVIDAIKGLPNVSFYNGTSQSKTIMTSGVSGKTDIKLSNIKMDIDAKSNNDAGNISINVGINSKFYKNQPFPDLYKKGQGTYKSNSGGTLKEALINLFGSDITKNYYAYNTLAHGDILLNEDKELKNAIMLRQFNKLFSISNELNQYMLLNGKIVSIWNLLNYAINNNIEDTQALQLSISKNDMIISSANTWYGEKPNYVNAMNRSRMANSIIDSSTIEATIHLNRISQAFK